ncbi:hypothetical protein B0H13DRAFT_1900598 [Mycena leptocephala]|nr:hypothetical protein B0H13DRAFT_1900598 [Mycena leptocephala]
MKEDNSKSVIKCILDKGASSDLEVEATNPEYGIGGFLRYTVITPQSPVIDHDFHGHCGQRNCRESSFFETTCQEHKANSAPSEILEAVGELPSSGRFQYRGHNRGLHSAWTILSSHAIQFRVALVKTRLLDGYNFRSMLWASVSAKMVSFRLSRKWNVLGNLLLFLTFFLDSQHDSEHICDNNFTERKDTDH